MSIEIIGIIGIIILFVLIFIQVPIGIAMALVGFLGVCAVRGNGPGLSVLGTEFFGVTTQYAFSVIPFFVGMGFFASEFELSADVFIPISKWIGHIRGGLTMASAVCCAIFAAISGSKP